jgi:hypothetical protein
VTLEQGGESRFVAGLTESKEKIPVAYGRRSSLRRQVLEVPNQAPDRFTGHDKAPGRSKAFPLRMPDIRLLAKDFTADIGFISRSYQAAFALRCART